MFSITRPTPTTVLYTVSTSPPTTLTTRLTTLLLTLLRLTAAAAVLLALFSEYSTAFPETLPPSIHHPALVLPPWLPSPTTLPPLPYRLALYAATAYLTLRKDYTQESLLVIRGLGVQTSTSAPSYLWTSSTRFIPTSSIQDVFIHEAFMGFEVRFYLCIVVDGEGEVVVVFPSIFPRREILEDVWRGTRACLFEPKA